MTWKQYKCLVDEFSIMRQGEKFLVNSSQAKDMKGNSLNIETTYVEEHSDPSGGDDYKFELLSDDYPVHGDGDDPGTGEDEVEKKDDGGLAKKDVTMDQYVILFDEQTKVMQFDSLDEARTRAESAAVSSAIVAKVVNVLKVKTITNWEV